MPSASTLSSAPAEAEAANESSGLVSRNITIAGHRTSCRLEPTMWEALYEICERERITIHRLCTVIDQRRTSRLSLTAAIRVFALAYFREASTEDGHLRASHGCGEPFIYDHVPELGQPEGSGA
jgi:predicted DNA-binding ribbon-helix-helix protein